MSQAAKQDLMRLQNIWGDSRDWPHNKIVVALAILLSMGIVSLIGGVVWTVAAFALVVGLIYAELSGRFPARWGLYSMAFFMALQVPGLQFITWVALLGGIAILAIRLFGHKRKEDRMPVTTEVAN